MVDARDSARPLYACSRALLQPRTRLVLTLVFLASRGLPVYAASMQALALPRMQVTRCMAQRADGGSRATPAAGAALARRQALCAGAALALGTQPRRAGAALSPPFTSAAGLSYYDDKVGEGEEAVRGAVADVAAARLRADAGCCRLPAIQCASCTLRTRWTPMESLAIRSTRTGLLAQARPRAIRSLWEIPTRTWRWCVPAAWISRPACVC
jgi:hypothetical protein